MTAESTSTGDVPAQPKVDLTAVESLSRQQRRLRLLAQVASLVDTPLDLQLTLQQVADLAISELADWCSVDLEPADDLDPALGGGTPGGARRPLLVAVAHRDPAMVALALELQERYPPPENDPQRAQVLADLAPLHFPEVTDEMLVAGARDAEHLAILRGLGMTAAVAVPLQAAGRGVGIMLLVATGGRRLDRDDVELAVELGRRAGAAVDKARLTNRLARTAAELALSEERYRTLVEASSMAVWRAAPDGTAITDMPAWRQVTGSLDTSGWGWFDDVHPDEQGRVRETWLRAVATGDMYQQTYRIRDVRGGWRWVGARGVPMRQDPEDPTSRILEWVGSVTDVTAEIVSRSRSQALRECAEALARAVDVAAVITSLQRVAGRALAASSVVVGIPDPHRLSVHQSGYDWSPALAQEVWGAAVPASAHGDGGEGPDPGTSLLLQTVFESRRPLFIRDGDDLLEVAEAPAAAAAAHRMIGGGEVAWAVLPLLYGGDVAAVVRFGWDEPQLFDSPYQWVLLAIAAQHAAALTRARMYEVERDRSLTLQAALAPNVRRSVNGVEVGVHYRPAGVQAQVGGDWADALALDDGRVVLAIGDVMGSGIPAAATMGRLRTALETLVRHGFDPVRILCDLDRLVLETPGDLLATLALAVLDRDAGRLELYNAGHLPALLCPPDGPPFQVEAPMVPPLGVGWSIAGPSAPKAAVDVAPGTVLALCTDGLLETRDSDIDERLALWRSAVQAQQPLGDLAAAARTLVDAIVPSQDDDVTLLLARASRLPR